MTTASAREGASSRASTALGSFLQFAGMACLTFPSMARRGTPFREALELFLLWRESFQASGAADETVILLENALEDLLRHCRSHAPDSSLSLALDEYNALFISPDAPVPLWESLWLSHEKILFTRETEQVRAFYHRFGMPLVRFKNEAEDHMGYELAFAGFLFDESFGNERRTDSLSAEEGLHDFLHKHLLRWVPEALRQLEASAQAPFWRGLFQTLQTVLQCLSEEG